MELINQDAEQSLKFLSNKIIAFLQNLLYRFEMGILRFAGQMLGTTTMICDSMRTKVVTPL